MNKRQVTIAVGDPRDPGAFRLLEASQTLMRSLFSVKDNHFLSVDSLCQPDIQFFVARLDDKIAGCGAMATRDGYAEIKSMFVDPASRGAQIGTKLLDHIEHQARQKSLPVLRLETGDKLIAAQKLYTAHGFSVCAAFGDYVASESSVFMEKYL